VETRSRNTRENALYTKETLKQHPELQKMVLVTSAFHMRRAAACFQKVGLEASIFPADFYSTDREFTIDALLMPSERALANWSKLFREITGYFTYRLLGYC